MQLCKKFPAFVCMLAIAMLTVGCGTLPASGVNNVNHPASPVASVTATPTLLPTAAGRTTGAAATVTPAEVVPVPTAQATLVPTQPSPTKGAVSLILSKTRFAPYEAIAVTIHNGLSTAITAGDHKSGCTLVALQMRTASGSWQTQAVCRQGSASRLITLPAGSSMPQTLQPGAGTFARGASWARGQYRFVFTFSAGVTDPTHELGMNPFPASSVYSQIFVVA